MAKRKQKSRLLRLMKGKETQEYETTLEDCKIWFNILNKEVFDGRLSPLHEIDIRQRRKTYAYYVKVLDDKNPSYIFTKLCMSKKYRSKQFFVEVLAHELIHHYQALFEQPLNHGPTFLVWRDKLNRKGINLVKVYIEDETP